MGTDRHSIIEAAEQMRSAVSIMQEIMRIASRSELRRSGRVQIESDIHSLEDNCPALYDTLMTAAIALRDDWPEIEKNKARVRETAKFFTEYQKFKACTLQFDDWRMECYDKDDIFPEAHQIAMSMVMLCGKCENELELMRTMLDELQHGGVSSDDPLLGFENAMREFCDIPYDGYLIEQILHTKAPIFPAIWLGAKNELTLFADLYRKDSAQIRTIFDFPDDKKTKTPFETSRYPAYKLPDDNRLKLLLRDYPKEKFYK